MRRLWPICDHHSVTFVNVPDHSRKLSQNLIIFHVVWQKRIRPAAAQMKRMATAQRLTLMLSTLAAKTTTRPHPRRPSPQTARRSLRWWSGRVRAILSPCCSSGWRRQWPTRRLSQKQTTFCKRSRPMSVLVSGFYTIAVFDIFLLNHSDSISR